MEADDEIEPAPDIVRSFESAASITLFEGEIWVRDGIDFRAMVAQN